MIPPSLRLVLAAAVGLAGAPCASRADTPLYRDTAAALEARVDDLLARLTQDEKLSMLGGDRDFYIRPIERLGLPEIKMADGPLGVRNYGLSTAYPGTIALAASWDAGLGREYGASVGKRRPGRAESTSCWGRR